MCWIVHISRNCVRSVISELRHKEYLFSLETAEKTSNRYTYNWYLHKNRTLTINCRQCTAEFNRFITLIMADFCGWDFCRK